MVQKRLALRGLRFASLSRFQIRFALTGGADIGDQRRT